MALGISSCRFSLIMLDYFFNPSSVAVIGASREEGKIGHNVLQNIIKFGYKGRVFPVNKKAEDILGLRCYSSVLDITEVVDLAVVVVPSAAVVAVMEEVGKKRSEKH